jgi:hypothetical protein
LFSFGTGRKTSRNIQKIFCRYLSIILSTEEAFLQDDPYGSLKLEASPNSFGIQVLALIGNNFAIEIIDFFYTSRGGAVTIKIIFVIQNVFLTN